MSAEASAREPLRWVPLREVATVVMGQSPPSSAYNTNGDGLPFFQGKAEFGAMYPTVAKWCKAPTKVAEPNDVLMSVRAPVGPTNLATERCCIGRGLAAIRPNPGVQSKWLLYAFRSIEKAIDDLGTGTTFKAISGETLRLLKVPVADLDHQDQVVSDIEKQFSRLDEGVANLKRVRANLKRYKAAVLKASVEGRLVPTEAELARREGRTYENGTQLLQRILDARPRQWKGKAQYKAPRPTEKSDLPELPEGWGWATMPQLGELNRGKSKHRPRDDPKLYGGPYPFIQTGDVRKSGGTIREHSQTYSECGLQQSRLWPAGTLCITIAANIAETGILTFHACFPDSVVGFIGEGGEVTTRYVEFFLRTAKEELERFAPATAQKNINLDVVQRVAVPIPPILEQHRIVAEVERRLSLVDEVDAEIRRNMTRADRFQEATLSAAFRSSIPLSLGTIHLARSEQLPT